MWSRLFKSCANKNEETTAIINHDNREEKKSSINCFTAFNSLSYLGNLVKFLGTAGLLAAIVDTTFDLESDYLGLSWWGWGIGGTLGLLSAIGSAHVHNIVNVNHQQENAIHLSADDQSDPTLALSLGQWLAIAGHLVDDTSGYALALEFVCAMFIVMRDLESSKMLIVHAASSAVGFFCSVPEINTGIEAIKIKNMREKQEMRPSMAV